jgi:hypothetical protein
MFHVIVFIALNLFQVPKVKPITGLAELQKNEVDVGPGWAHVKYCEMQTNNVVNLLDKLF